MALCHMLLGLCSGKTKPRHSINQQFDFYFFEKKFSETAYGNAYKMLMSQLGMPDSNIRDDEEDKLNSTRDRQRILLLAFNLIIHFRYVSLVSIRTQCFILAVSSIP